MLVVPEKILIDKGSIALPRLGQINFVNCLPVVVPMRQSRWQENVQVVYATPSQLNQSFQDGTLDIGAMSSFYFLKNGNMELVEGLSIASDGAVASVVCYSKRPLAELHGARIAIPTSSATSVMLLSVLLREVFSVVPELTLSDAPDIQRDDIDAALVIGDQALWAEKKWSAKLVRADLGEWWRINTGLPMVFGVWAARRSWAVNANASFKAIANHLREAVATGLSTQFPEVVQEGCARTGLSAERMLKYFKTDLNFQWTERHAQGLEMYRQLCLKHGLLN
jgi:chorismate dehydratase